MRFDQWKLSKNADTGVLSWNMLETWKISLIDKNAPRKEFWVIL